MKINVKNGTAVVASKEITESDNWTYTFNNLPVKDDQGNEITYTVTDARGNTTTKTAVITVVERDDSEENEGQQNADEL